jgi:phytoene dehydrogenase-like protein
MPAPKRSEPVVVIGAGLAGLAAAARLAKAGHHVTLLESTDRLGGSWAKGRSNETDVDVASPIITFPAPWRDLFRKSGRAMEAELTRQRMELAPAPPAMHRFPDGTELELPAGRGDQQSVIGRQFGRSSAAAWGRLLDEQANRWQLLRSLGFESELQSKRQLTRSVRHGLGQRQTLADLAEAIPDPRLAAVVADVAYTQHSRPVETPAFAAVALYLEQAFGRWTLGSASAMIDVLQARLALRGVQLQRSRPAYSIMVDHGRVSGVTTADETFPAAAVVATCDPFQLYDDLLPDRRVQPERRRLHRLPAALVPRRSHAWIDAPPAVTETITHRESGGPLIEYTQPADQHSAAHQHAGPPTLSIRHDYGAPESDPAAGVGWQGFGSWLDRPPVTTGTTGLFAAGPFSRAGTLPSAQLLSGALATYGAQLLLDPDRPLKPQ